jgi:hypothetical protein
MQKLNQLYNLLSSFGLKDESSDILKLARKSDFDYNEIAKEIIRYISEDPDRAKYYLPGHPNSYLFNLKSYYKKLSPEQLKYFQNKDKEFKIIISVPDPINDSMAEGWATKAGPEGSEEYKKQLALINDGNNRKWKTIGGNMETKINGNQIFLIANIFLTPEEYNLNKNNLIKYIQKTPDKVSLLIHELAHLINRARNNPEKDWRAKTDALAEKERENTLRNNPGYVNSTEEIQARIAQLFAIISDDIVSYCPDLNYKNCKNKFGSITHIIMGANFPDFFEYITKEYKDLLLINNLTTKDTMSRYRARLYEMYQYFRNLLKIEDTYSGFSDWNADIIDSNTKNIVNKIISDYPDKIYSAKNKGEDEIKYGRGSLYWAIDKAIEIYGRDRLKEEISRFIANNRQVSKPDMLNKLIEIGLIISPKESAVNEVSELLTEFIEEFEIDYYLNSDSGEEFSIEFDGQNWIAEGDDYDFKNKEDDSEE